MSAYTDKAHPRTLKSGLLALVSGGRSFEEGSHLCFTYFKKIEKCHKLLSVFVGDLVQTCSYSIRDGRQLESGWVAVVQCVVHELTK